LDILKVFQAQTNKKQFRLGLLSKTKSQETSIEDAMPISIISHLLKAIAKAIK
jgi:hypothetical protein